MRRESDRVRVEARRDFVVDAAGELARVDDTPVWWDAASVVPSVAQVGATVVVNALAVTGTVSAAGDLGWLVPDVDDDRELVAVLGGYGFTGGDRGHDRGRCEG